MTRDKWTGHAAIFAANIFFGLNIPIAKSLMPEWVSPIGLTLLRMSFGAFAFWMASLFIVNEKVAKKDMIILFVGALFGMTINQFLFVVGLFNTSPIDASMIITLNPVIVMIISALVLKEPITSMKAGGVLVGATGALLIILNSAQSEAGQGGSLLGNLQILLSTTFYAAYLVITRPVSQRYHPVTLMKWMFLFATIISVPFGFQDVLVAPAFNGTAELNVFARILFVVLFATFVAYFMIPIALKRIRPTTVSMYNYVQPLIASVIAIIIGQDVLTWDKPVAAILVFTGVYLVTQSKSKEDMEKKRT